MQNKKGSMFIFIVIGIITILLISFIVIYLGFSKKAKDQNKKIPPTLQNITLYLKAIEHETKQPIESNFVLFYKNGDVNKQGVLISDWNEFEIPAELTKIYCFNKDYYFTETYKDFTQEQISNKKDTLICDMKKKGEISVTHKGKLNNGESQLFLNVSSNGEIKKLSACFEWTANIISIAIQNTGISCDNWVNYSFYDSITNEYIYLPEGYYKCGEEIEKCKKNPKETGNICEEYKFEKPLRYSEKTDICHYFGKSLSNSSYQVYIIVKTLNTINTADYIKVYFFDQDKTISALDYTADYKENNERDFEYQVNYDKI